MNIKQIASQANWQSVETRPTWSTVTTAELSIILNVPQTSINNWLLRNKFPSPEVRKKGQGNKNRYKISKIRAWLENKSETEIHWEFIETHMGKGFESIEQAIWNAKHHWRAFELEKAT